MLPVLIFTIIWLANRAIAAPWNLEIAAEKNRHDRSFRNQEKGSKVSVPLKGWIAHNADLQWYTIISIGTSPAQKLTVLIDSGSSGLLIPQSNCTTCGTDTKLFDPSLSSTFSTLPGDEVDPEFSTGGDTVPLNPNPQGATCHLYTDNVSLGGLSVPSYTFLLCDSYGPALAEQVPDGILGLGIYDPTSFYWSLWDSGKLQTPTFGLYTPPRQENGGVLTLGGIDSSKFAGPIEWVNLDANLSKSHQSWVMELQAFHIGKKRFRSPGNIPYPPSLSILDSGTSYILAPDYNTTRDLYAQIDDNIMPIDSLGAWGAPCWKMDSIARDITITFGPATGTQLNVTIPKRFFNLGPYAGQPGICQAVFSNPIEAVTNDDGRGVWIIGSPLLKNYYTAWNGIDLKVGFAHTCHS